MQFRILMSIKWTLTHSVFVHASVLEKTKLVLLLIYSLMYLPFIVGFCVCLCFGTRNVMSFLVLLSP